MPALYRNSPFAAETSLLLAKTRSLPQTAVPLGMKLTILAEVAQPPPPYSTGIAFYYEKVAHTLCQSIRTTPALLQDLHCALPSAMFYLAAGQAFEAIDFLPEQSRAAHKGVNVHDGCGQYLARADLPESLGHKTRNGFRFRPEGGFLPQCALEARQKALFLLKMKNDRR